MGGWGSTRWNGYEKAALVERCFPVNVTRLVRDAPRDDEVLEMDFEVPIRFGPCLHLSLHWPERRLTAVPATHQGISEVTDDVQLVERRTPTGGNYWVGRCPGCSRPARDLYLLRRGSRLRCRGCHGLTYVSAQRHDKRVDQRRLSYRLRGSSALVLEFLGPHHHLARAALEMEGALVARSTVPLRYRKSIQGVPPAAHQLQAPSRRV